MDYAMFDDNQDVKPPKFADPDSSSSPSSSPSHLGLDPDDPLNLLLHNVAQNADSPMLQDDSSASSHSSPPDWSELSNLWSQNDGGNNSGNSSDEMSTNMKLSDPYTDFNFSFPMDLDLNPAISAVDPSALHFDSSAFGSLNLGLPGMHEHSQQPFPTNNTDFSGTDMLSLPFDLSLSGLDAPPMMPEEYHLQPNGLGGRRLSITSSSGSSSGLSLFPVISSSDQHSVGTSSPDVTEELANRVRQTAGVTFAVQVSAQMQQALGVGGTQPKLPIPRLPRPANMASANASPNPHSPTPSAKPKQGSSPSVSSSPSPAPSSPAPATSTSGSPAPAAANSTPPPPTTSARPKTSHTTIERRYRTNLNARIQSLRRTVPALRVLEQRENAAKEGAGKVEFVDAVDERGFVDGVKVARKTSKASILGKAVEYIRVLKKREARLKREQDGLRCLISGLVGGPALLKEWEREWRERFGGEEKDEVEGEEAEPMSDEEDEEGGPEEGEDEGRARKKVKLAVKVKEKKEGKKDEKKGAQAGAVGADGQVVPEKRKRGRPRKVPIAPVTAPATAPATAATHASAPAPAPASSPNFAGPVDSGEEQMQGVSAPAPGSGQSQQQQYLLAAFAFFSFFNSPLTSSSHAASSSAHTHTGHVLTAQTQPEPHLNSTTAAFVNAGAYATYGWRDAVRVFHLLVSALVLASFVWLWLPARLRRSRAAAWFVSPFSVGIPSLRTPSASPKARTVGLKPEVSSIVDADARRACVKGDAPRRSALVEALSPSHRGTSSEAGQLRRALGVYTAVQYLVRGLLKNPAKSRGGYELRQLEQRAWVRLGELVALDDHASMARRLQTYCCMRLRTPAFKASPSDLTTLALIIRPLWRVKASWLWHHALKTEFVRPYERLALQAMDVDEAAEALSKHRGQTKGSRSMEHWGQSPLRLLAGIIIKERLRTHARMVFVRTVGREQGDKVECGDYFSYADDAEKDHKVEEERKEVIGAGKSLGGRIGILAEILEKVWETGFCSLEDLDSEAQVNAGATCDAVEGDVRAILRAIILYRQVFPSHLTAVNGTSPVSVVLSPPPSPPSRKSIALHVELRRTLGSPAFDPSAAAGPATEEEERLGEFMYDVSERVVDTLVEMERVWRGRADRF